MGKRIPLAERFWRKVTPDGDCLLWTGATDKSSGYGRIRIDGETRYAHRTAYELAFGAIPEGMHIDHLCRVRHCVSPAHLEPVTPAENNHRGETNAGKTHCSEGHPLEGDNLLIVNAATGTRRRCGTCTRARMREYMRAYRRRTAA